MINTSWFIKHKPNTIEEYVFESAEQKTQVLEWIQEGAIPGNLVLFGPAGTGKTALAEIIIRSIILSQHDLNRIIKRSVAVIDELHTWLQKRPVKSKQKIVYLEEFDKVSKEAKGTLKDGLMEKYQEHAAFVCTTNHFNRIEYALQTRFTHKFNLICTNVEGVIIRLQQILAAEAVQYDQEKLKIFVEKNIGMGLRDLINTLQVNSVNNAIDFEKVILQRSELEEEIIKLTISMLETIFKTPDVNNKKLCVVNPANSPIGTYYTKMIEIIQYNQNIDYYEIFTRVDEQVPFLPVKSLINRFATSLENQHSPYLHYIDFLYQAFRAIVEINV